MSAQQAPAPPQVNNVLVFFSSCSTRWEDLSTIEKDSCIGQDRLQRQIGGLYYAWPPAGELLKQWNDRGYEEYTTVLKRKNEEKANRRFFSKKKLVARPLLFLLSETVDRDQAIPFILVSSKDKQTIKEVKALFEKHSRLCSFGFECMANHSELQFTAFEELISASHLECRNINSMSEKNEMTYPAVSGLSGARIRVVKQITDRTSEPTSRLATISGTCRIGDTFYLLTAAHVFFDGFSSTESWADSELYANSGTSSVFYDQVKLPKVTGSFAVSIEYDNRSQGGSNTGTATTALGLVSISLSHGRYATTSVGSRNVILDFDLDWALIELHEPHHWVPTQLHQSSNDNCFLGIPEDSGQPPPGPLLLITGVSGIVKATSMGSIGGLVLPWCQEEIKTGLLECSIAVGDCGSIVVGPKTGTVYGLVVAHDSDMLLTYLIPIKAIIDRVSAVFPGLGDSSGNLFLTSLEATSETLGLSQAAQKGDPGKEQDDGTVDKRTVDKQPADSNNDNDISIMAEYHRKLAENSL